jgi:HWE histidine kinase
MMRESIESLLFALSRSHDLLTRENWHSAGLRDVIRLARKCHQEKVVGGLDGSGISASASVATPCSSGGRSSGTGVKERRSAVRQQPRVLPPIVRKTAPMMIYRNAIVSGIDPGRLAFSAQKKRPP